MKQYSYLWLASLLVMVSLSSCEMVEGIFKAGFYAAIFWVVIVVVIIIWLVNRFRRR